MQDTAGQVIRYLVVNARCTDCGGDFRTEDIHVLAQPSLREWDVAAVCHGCRTLTLIRAVVQVEPDCPDVESETRGELTAAEVRYFDRKEPVSKDDVLDVAEFLERFDGDFRELFSQERDGP